MTQLKKELAIDFKPFFLTVCSSSLGTVSVAVLLAVGLAKLGNVKPTTGCYAGRDGRNLPAYFMFPVCLAPPPGLHLEFCHSEYLIIEAFSVLHARGLQVLLLSSSVLILSAWFERLLLERDSLRGLLCAQCFQLAGR